MPTSENVLIKFNAYLKERTEVLLNMEMCVAQRVRLDEHQKTLQAFEAALQNALKAGDDTHQRNSPV